jgi:hypothetical protein
MNERARQISAPLARWSSRIAIFSASLVVVGLLLHRLTSFPTPVALNLFFVAFVGATVALLAGLIALAQIWHSGYGGAGGAAVGILLPLLMAVWPLAYVQAYRNMPALNDVTTDLASPPRFTALAKQRVENGNGPIYPAARFAEVQQKGYPDLRTFVIERPVEESFELVEETAARLRWKVVASEAPVGKTAKGGVLEATDQTLVMGFTDDIVVRVEGNLNRSRIDIRSASRFGSFDLGQNATRVRRFLAELKARSETTSPQVAGRRGLRSTRTGAMAKRAKDKLPEKAVSRNERDRAQSSAQRARAQKETQR